jgi:aminopeptidase N
MPLLFLLTGCQPMTVPLSTPAISTPVPTTGRNAGAAGLGDPLYPNLGNGGYDALHYTLDLAVDMQSHALSGTTTIAARATQALSSFNFDLQGLQITNITVNKTPATYRRAASELTITPAEPLTKGVLFTTTVVYQGIPTGVADPGVPFEKVGWLVYKPGNFVLSEPSGAMSWYPVNNHPLDKASYTFRITVAKPYVVAANGVLAAEADHGATRTYLWEAHNPLASYLTTIDIAEFTVTTTEGPHHLPIRNYLPPNASQTVKNALRPTADMLQFYSDLVGPFPFEAYGAIVLDDNYPTALEAQTRPVFGMQILSEAAVAHELSHQWFGDSVSLTTWRDIWLNEGFATYLENLWIEHQQGRAALDANMHRMYAYIVREKLAAPASPALPDLFGPAVYMRGAWTLHALRLQVGDALFFKLLRTYYQQYQNGNASTADFITVAEAVSGQKLDSFFKHWLYDATVPPEPKGAA